MGGEGQEGQMMRNMGQFEFRNEELYPRFLAAVNESLVIATLAASFVAVVVSAFISHQVVSPVRRMMGATRHIAEGHYQERVQVHQDLDEMEMDELDQLALSFNQMASRLEQTESMRQQLIGDVAHELRTPLTTIKGSMEGLIDGVLQPEVETYQKIYREADRMGRLVFDLQELSRVEAGAYELDLQDCSPSDLVANTVERLEGQFEEKGVALSVNIPDDQPGVLADEDRIGQVLLNLVGNALQYTPSGGEVEITVLNIGGESCFRFTDTGIGIDPKHIPHIFTRFYRADKSRSRTRGGSGIGLTIARHLVEAHRGRIWAESEGLGTGSCFTLPLAEVS
jgi:histidine kinase